MTSRTRASGRSTGADPGIRLTPAAAPIWPKGSSHTRSPRGWRSQALAALASGVILYLGRGSFFYFDEWTWIVERRDWTTSTLLRPHNEHLSAVPIAIYKVLFATVGLAHYWPYRAMLVAIHLSAALAVYLIARRRLGPWLALAPATILLFLGAAHEDLMWPFQMGFIGATAAGAWALWALDRNTRRGDLLAAIALTVSLGCASPGIPMVVAAFAELAWRRTTWRRLWVVGIPSRRCTWRGTPPTRPVSRSSRRTWPRPPSTWRARLQRPSRH